MTPVLSAVCTRLYNVIYCLEIVESMFEAAVSVVQEMTAYQYKPDAQMFTYMILAAGLVTGLASVRWDQETPKLVYPTSLFEILS